MMTAKIVESRVKHNSSINHNRSMTYQTWIAKDGYWLKIFWEREQNRDTTNCSFLHNVLQI